jgi:outer membrane cobalamin receptor
MQISKKIRGLSYLALVSASLMLSSPSMAATITGTVADSLSGVPLQGVSVEVLGLGRGDVTGSDGIYKIETIPAGSHAFRFSHVGFYTVVIEHVVVSGDEVIRLGCLLYSEAIPMKELEVLGVHEKVSDIELVPAFVTVVSEEDFNGQSTSVSEILSSTTGVQVKQLGGMGAFSSVSIRGSSAEQVDIYLDGIPLNTAMGGGVDLSNLPLSQIGQIEIYRGAGAEGGGVGGAVHIKTRRAEKGVQVGGRGSWGSFGTRNANGMFSRRTPGQELLVVADLASSDNSFQFLDDNGTEYNQNDDLTVKRRNEDFLSASALGKWNRDIGRASEYHLQGNFFWKRQGIPGISNNQAQDARLNTSRGLMQVGLSSSDWLGRLSVAQTLFYSRRVESFIDRAGEIGVGRQDNRNRTSSIGWQNSIQTVVGGEHLVSLGSAISREGFLPEERLQPEANLLESTRWSISGGVGIDWGLPHQSGTLTTSLDLERQQNHLLEENPFQLTPIAPDTNTVYELVNVRAGIRVDALPGVWLKASVGRSHRAPSFYEMFGDRGGVIGNTDLVPERGTAWDIGFKAQWRETMLEIAYFGQHYGDLIQFVQFSQGVGRAQNIGKARVSGIETTFGTKVANMWKLSGNYTHQEAIDRSSAPHRNGKLLPNKPRHEIHVHTSLGVALFHFFYDYTFSAGNFLDRANLRPIPERHIHNVGIRVNPWRQVEITLEAKNLMDNQIADLWGYPLPGRSFFMTVQEGF